MKDLLLLPFYLTAFFSNSLDEIGLKELNQVEKEKIIEFKIDLQKNFIWEMPTLKTNNKASFDKDAFKLELLKKSRKK
jgi:hypothetical protein